MNRTLRVLDDVERNAFWVSDKLSANGVCNLITEVISKYTKHATVNATVKLTLTATPMSFEKDCWFPSIDVCCTCAIFTSLVFKCTKKNYIIYFNGCITLLLGLRLQSALVQVAAASKQWAVHAAVPLLHRAATASQNRLTPFLQIAWRALCTPLQLL